MLGLVKKERSDCILQSNDWSVIAVEMKDVAVG